MGEDVNALEDSSWLNVVTAARPEVLLCMLVVPFMDLCAALCALCRRESPGFGLPCSRSACCFKYNSCTTKWQLLGTMTLRRSGQSALAGDQLPPMHHFGTQSGGGC